MAHPIIFRYVEDARAANRDLKIIVADPRRSESAEIADLHLAIKPGTDIALFNGMLNVLIAEDLVVAAYVAAHTNGFGALAEIAKNYPPAVVAEICGVEAADIVKAARWFGSSAASLSMYCQGLNQSAHGTHNNAGIIHLHLATGQIGKPGSGPFSLTGHPNAMGGREAGGMASLLPGHRDPVDAAHRAEVASLWGRGFAYFCVLTTVFVTALYTFRLMIMTFHGKERMNHHTREHLHESPSVVTVPLIVLAIPRVISGWII